MCVDTSGCCSDCKSPLWAAGEAGLQPGTGPALPLLGQAGGTHFTQLRGQHGAEGVKPPRVVSK